MSLDLPNNQKKDEVDFTNSSQGVGKTMSGFGGFVFKTMQFVIRNIIIVALLLIVGFALGIYLDSSAKKYNHTLTVSPNFGSVEYLYSKIELLQSKIRENDTVFLKSVGFSNPSAIRKIKIEPIVDIYRLAKQEDIYFRTLSLLAEGASMQQVMEDKVTARNYRFHQIMFSSNNPISEKGLISELLAFLNESAFFAKLQTQYRSSLESKIVANESTLTEIDNILRTSVQNSEAGKPASGTIVYTEKSQLNDVILTKNLLLHSQEENRIDMMMYDKIIKESTVMVNMKQHPVAGGIMKFLVPLVFILIFALIVSGRKYYYYQKAKYAVS